MLQVKPVDSSNNGVLECNSNNWSTTLKINNTDDSERWETDNGLLNTQLLL